MSSEDKYVENYITRKVHAALAVGEGSQVMEHVHRIEGGHIAMELSRLTYEVRELRHELRRPFWKRLLGRD